MSRSPIHHADMITTDRGPVRLSSLRPEQTVTIHGRRIKVGQIPVSFYTLECGHKSQGVAVNAGHLIFCESCQTQKVVVVSKG